MQRGQYHLQSQVCHYSWTSRWGKKRYLKHQPWPHGPPLKSLLCGDQRAISQGTELQKTSLPFGCMDHSKRDSQNPPLPKTVTSRVSAPGTTAPHQMRPPGGGEVGALGAHSCRWWGHQHNSGTGWVHWGKRKKKTCHFSFFLFEVTKLQGSGGNCGSDFILREAGGCLPGAAAHGVIYIASRPGVEKEALPFLRSSASLESGPLPHPDCLRPLIFSPPRPPPDLRRGLTSFPDRSRGLIPMALKGSWRTKEELFRAPGTGCRRGALGGPHGVLLLACALSCSRPLSAPTLLPGPGLGLTSSTIKTVTRLWQTWGAPEGAVSQKEE